jgi:uncharacterized protein (DUF4415 family)
MRPVQKFTEEYLRQCKTFSTSEIVKYLEGFRVLASVSETSSQKSDRSKLISLRVEERLLDMFRKKAGDEGVKYQTKLKELMRSYIFETIDPERCGK